jgi:hypothetical protein
MAEDFATGKVYALPEDGQSSYYRLFLRGND